MLSSSKFLPVIARMQNHAVALFIPRLPTLSCCPEQETHLSSETKESETKDPNEKDPYDKHP